MSAPSSSASSVSRNVRVCELGPYASTLMSAPRSRCLGLFRTIHRLLLFREKMNNGDRLSMGKMTNSGVVREIPRLGCGRVPFVSSPPPARILGYSIDTCLLQEVTWRERRGGDKKAREQKWDPWLLIWSQKSSIKNSESLLCNRGQIFTNEQHLWEGGSVYSFFIRLFPGTMLVDNCINTCLCMCTCVCAHVLSRLMPLYNIHIK